MSTAGQGQAEQQCYNTGSTYVSVECTGVYPTTETPIQNLTLLILLTPERHIAAVLGVHGELQSPKKLAHLMEVDIAEKCYMFMSEMGISYKEKEYLCRRETKILVDRMNM